MREYAKEAAIRTILPIALYILDIGLSFTFYRLRFRLTSVQSDVRPCGQQPCYRKCAFEKGVVCDLWNTCSRLEDRDDVGA